jgi:hypothetical protein
MNNEYNVDELERLAKIGAHDGTDDVAPASLSVITVISEITFGASILFSCYKPNTVKCG